MGCSGESLGVPPGALLARGRSWVLPVPAPVRASHRVVLGGSLDAQLANLGEGAQRPQE